METAGIALDGAINRIPSAEAVCPSPQWVVMGGIIMFEYLCNMGAIAGARTFFVDLPLKLPASDGAPARAIAIDGLIAD